MKAIGSLNHTPQAEEAISRYISRDWGFKTKHYGTDKADQLAGSEVDDKFFGSTKSRLWFTASVLLVKTG